MPTLAPERAEELVTSWLTTTEPFDGIEHPSGPLFADGYAEYEITLTGGLITNCCLCTGSAGMHCC